MFQINRKPERASEPVCCECGGNILDVKADDCVKRGVKEPDEVRSDALLLGEAPPARLPKAHNG